MMLKLKRAFTLLEVVFVIVILGVVSSIGSSVIVQVFESYIIQKATHNAAIKTELAINQLANRLSYRIDTSLVARNDAGNMLPLRDISIATPNWEDFRHLEWIGYDNDSFSATATPGWSGFLDLDNIFAMGGGSRGIHSTGSDFSQTNTAIGNLGGSPALHFVGLANYRLDAADVPIAQIDANCLHDTIGNGCIFPVALGDPDRITFTVGSGDYVAGQMQYSEYYQLARSAYAVVFEPAPAILGTEVWDLYLYYNYQPWEGEAYVDTGISKSILLRNVSVFRFKSESGNSLRIKLCSIERISETEKISLCKEKAVIR